MSYPPMEYVLAPSARLAEIEQISHFLYYNHWIDKLQSQTLSKMKRKTMKTGLNALRVYK